MDATIQVLAHGWRDAGRVFSAITPELAALVGAFVVAFAVLAWILAAILSKKEADATLEVVTVAGDYRTIYLNNNKIKKLGLTTLFPIIVQALDNNGKALGKKRRYTLRYRTKGLQENQIEIHPAAALDLGIDSSTEEGNSRDGLLIPDIKFQIKNASVYSPAGLWNHPDSSIRIGFRTAVALTLFQILVQEPIVWLTKLALAETQVLTKSDGRTGVSAQP